MSYFKSYSSGGGADFMPQAPDAGTWLAQGGDWVSSFLQGGITSYRWDDNTDATDPGTGKIKANNSDLSQVTQLYIHDTSFSGLDATAIVIQLGRGDVIVLGQFEDNTTYAQYIITGFAVDNSGWFTIDVIYLSGAGAFTANVLVNNTIYELGNRKAFGTAILTATLPLSNDQATPTPIAGWDSFQYDNGLAFDAVTGGVQNLKGHTIITALGALSMQFDVTGGGNGRLVVASQRSLDGITWTYIANTARVYSSGNATDDFIFVEIGIDLWQAGEYWRVVAYTDGNNGQLAQQAEPFENQVVSGFAAALSVKEL